ncbi:hypothetical protein FISHEDRAFT_73393 [Fistulina hepatica ATCC 64428]|uniref:Uncharacterized protein n=1 Tax=Fistulina hepatica ATCC 64428 TaxID=1128425 RepID=A0A0D7AFM9_9AGAR|nr:hypothetical protein FISHEDRAFT_73393 [Fistulina hepatica ATCC 64428]
MPSESPSLLDAPLDEQITKEEFSETMTRLFSPDRVQTQSINGPLSSAAIRPDELASVEWDIPPASPIAPLIAADNDVILGRWLVSLELGSKFTGRPSPRFNGSNTIRKVFYTKLFKTELSRLRHVLKNFIAAPGKEANTWAFRLDIQPYRDLMSALHRLQTRAAASFELMGEDLPTIPRWSRDGKPTLFYTPDDFEILQIFFQAEVELFLACIDVFFDNVRGTVRHTDEPDPPQPKEEQPPSQVPPPARVSIHLPREAAPSVSMALPYQIDPRERVKARLRREHTPAYGIGQLGELLGRPEFSYLSAALPSAIDPYTAHPAANVSDVHRFATLGYARAAPALTQVPPSGGDPGSDPDDDGDNNDPFHPSRPR